MLDDPRQLRAAAIYDMAVREFIAAIKGIDQSGELSYTVDLIGSRGFGIRFVGKLSPSGLSAQESVFQENSTDEFFALQCNDTASALGQRLKAEYESTK